MSRISVLNIPAYLHKAKFYDIVINFEEFCGLIDKSFKKTKFHKNFNVSNPNIDDTKETIEKHYPKLSDCYVKRLEQRVAIANGVRTEPEFTQTGDGGEMQIEYVKKVNDHITIIGIVDYIKDGILYETKRRKNKLFKELYESEKIQLQLYMYITEHYVSTLEETYKNDTFRINEEFDKIFVDDILEQLEDYYNTVKDFLNDTSEYYKCADKEVFITYLRGF